MPRSRTDKKQLTATMKQAEALRLRSGGMAFDDIARTLGYASRQAAHKAVMSALKKTLQEPADELRVMEAERLDRMLEGLWKKAIGGDTWSVDRVLSIMERRAKLLGLDSPGGSDDVTRHLGSFLAGVQAQKDAAKDLSE